MFKRLTDIPGPRSRALLERRERAVPRGPFNVAPVFVKSARGAIVEDVDGNTYVDFAGGLGCLNVGACAGEVVEAVREQAGEFTHTCFHVAMHEPYIELAERLNALTPGDFPKKTFFANSGAEAVENAVKIARSYTGRPAVIAFEDAFHGRTLLALTLTSKVKPYKFGFGPFAPEVYRLPYAYCYRCPFGVERPECETCCAGAALEDFFKRHVAAESVAAIIVEPVLGEGGFVVPPREFLSEVQKVCRAHGILLIADEVQTGMGRTGTLFACEQFGLEPDLLVAAKSLGGGLPLSSITGRAEVMEQPSVGGLGGTFGGNPLACRAALAVLDLIERENLCARAAEIGRKVLERFRLLQQKYEIIGDARGLGAMCALELVRDRRTKEPDKEATERFTRLALQRGLLTITAGTFGNVVRTLMPLVITDEELEFGLDVIEQTLEEIEDRS
ncbi:MAG TPA: 4-aminobutyrate--2-oxoglutarate transaminase [Pyrinomonadaceae bacterium]|jgi:4-aminobutyrate aminotransferase/(S)-3-amino-2-methylpropionate transaminase|nr:4-aminobutyrate--2-oxoglutarate transaminase [Pyrinomonadaceae bacterium]